MAFKAFERVALWTGTGFCGLSAVCFAVNAGATLLNHPERTGELYGMATAAAIFAFLTSRLRDTIRERSETERLVAAPAQAASLRAGSPDWDAAGLRSSAAAPVDGERVRVERDCPYCAERILVAAKMCKHCRSDVSTV